MLLSPSVVIAVERDNVDWLIFGMLMAVALLMARPGIAGIVLMGATALKIYPTADLAVLVIRKKPAFKTFPCCSVPAVILESYLIIANGNVAGGLGETSCCFGFKVVAMI